ncbi:hypothetical protein GCM10028808_60470 [Spirosoma migulaei]
MLLFITATSEGIYYEEMCFSIIDYESAFDLLTQLVVEQWNLHQAVIIDNIERIELPVAAFDGQPVQVPMRALEQQWQQLLANSPASFRNGTELSPEEWYRQVEAYYDKMLLYLGQMILWLEMKQVKVSLIRDQELGHRLWVQYDSLLISNRRMFQQTKEKHSKNRQRLQALAP